MARRRQPGGAGFADPRLSVHQQAKGNLLILALLLVAAPAPPPPAAVGAWVQYRWQQPGEPVATLRFAVVGGDADGRRRHEIEVVKAGRLGRFGYDSLADGSRARQVAQLGAKGAVLLIEGDTPAPKPPEPLVKKKAKKVAGKLAQWRTVKVPAGRFRCRVIQSVEGESCVDEGLMPMAMVVFKGGDGSVLTLIGRGFDATPRMLAKPMRLPLFDQRLLKGLTPPPVPFTP
jgi:hypothetical protein